MQKEKHDKQRRERFPTHNIIEVSITSVRAAAYRNPRQFWCLECLGIIGGFGGNSKARDPQYTCQQIKDTPRAGNRVKRAWKSLKNAKNLDGSPVTIHQVSEWVRNLLDDGDIESNPGPQDITIFNQNVASAPNCWSLLRRCVSDPWDVLVIQETHMNPKEQNAFGKWAWKSGYRFFHVPAHETNGVLFHGVGILVRKPLRSRLLFSKDAPLAQVLAVNVEGLNILNLYLSPKGQDAPFLQAILEWLSTKVRGVPWLIVGDWNQTPQDNAFCDLLQSDGATILGCRSEGGSWSPTRWNGSRAIDYGITNSPNQFSQPSFVESVESDHKGFVLHGTPPSQRNPNVVTRIAPRTNRGRPPKVDLQTWQKTVSHYWAFSQPFCLPERLCPFTVDHVWDLFSQKLDWVLGKSLLHLHSRLPDDVILPSSFRANDDPPKSSKGPPRIIRTSVPCGPQNQPNSSFQERKIQRRIHQLRSYMERRDKKRFNNEFKDLQFKIRRFCPDLTMVDQCHDSMLKDLKVLRQKLQDKHILAWRHRLQSSQTNRHQWLKYSNAVPSVNLTSSRLPLSPTTSNATEAVQLLTEHWRTIWDRTTNWKDAFEHVIQSGCLPTCEPLESEPLTPELLQSVAGRLNGKAGGADGWTGSELAELPLEIWEFTQKIFHLIETHQVIPKVWCMARQIHIPKVGMNSSEPQDCKNFRPITILSVWYRVWSGSRLKSVKTQQWLRRWWPQEAIGGGPKCELFDALFAINNQTEHDEFLCSLDYSLAFDHTHPKLVTNLFRQIGLSESVVKVLETVWTNQMRYMQFDSVTSEYPESVSSSLPQGDAWSLIGMVLTLAGPSKAIMNQVDGLTLFTFVDDRTFTAKSAEDLTNARNLWASWSTILGLQENDQKTLFFHKKEGGKADLLAVGVPQTSISDHPKILGHELKNSNSRSCTDNEKARWQEAISQIRRARWLPVSWPLRKTAIAQGPIAKAVTGWFWRKPTQKMINQMQLTIATSLSEARCGSTYLRHLLRGHGLHVHFMITSRLVGAAWRQVHKKPRQAPIDWKAKGFVTVFSQLLSQWDWKCVQPGVWRHDKLGELSLKHPLKKVDLILHNLRESFRMWCWKKHHGQGRRDSWPNMAYNADRCQVARKAAEGFLNFQVLCGGTVSPACFSKMKQREMPMCAECHEAMTLDHAWICPKFQDMRLMFIGHESSPTCPFARRTGWGDTKVLGFLVKLRRLWLDQRWGDI